MSEANSPEEKNRRYRVWGLANEKAAEPELKREKQNPARVKQQVNKLSDLETLLLMYNYGHPMEMTAKTKCTPPGGQATSCATTTLTSEAIDFVYTPASPDEPETRPQRIAVGSVVSLEMEEVGAFKGVLTSQNDAGFQVAIKKENQKALATKLAHIAVERGIGVQATGTIKPGVPRIEPVRKECDFADQKGMMKTATIVNVSRYDALLRAPAAMIPPVGSRIVLRGPEWHGAEVISAFEIGFIVKFTVPIPEDKFSSALRFSEK